MILNMGILSLFIHCRNGRGKGKEGRETGQTARKDEHHAFAKFCS